MKFLAAFYFCVAATSYSQHQPFRFAWLTDTHVGSPTGEADLRCAVRDINGMTDVPFVIISGDVTEMGSTAELVLAKRILDGLRMPYRIVPGNHDTKWSESGCSVFPRLWGDDKFVFDSGGCRFIACTSGPNMRMGDGHVPQEDLRWLDSVVMHMPDPAQPVIFINHYPLDDGLDNWYDVLARIKRVNTVAALCGHGHVNQALSFEGVPGIMGRSLLRTGSVGAGYTLVDVRSDSIVFTERTLPLEGPAAERRWHAILVVRRDYAKDTARYPRPDYSVNTKNPAARVRWQTQTGSTIGCSPAVAGSVVIVGTAKGVIEAFSVRNGKKLWSFATGGSVYSTPAIGRVASQSPPDGKDRSHRTRSSVRSDSVLCAVVGSADGVLYCLNAANGRLLWKHAADGPVVASPLIADGVVYCGGSDGVFRALSLSTGEPVWEYRGVAGFVESTPLLFDGKIVFGAWDTFLYALDARSGVPAWKWSNGSTVRNLSPAACTPVGADGRIFIVAPDRVMTAIDAATGTTVWRTKAHRVRESIGLSEDAHTVYARTMNDTLVAVASAPNAPVTLWSLSCGYGYDIAPSMPVEKDGSIFFGTKNGLVYCIDAGTHRDARRFKVGNSIVNTVRPVSSTDVVVSSTHGTLTRLHFLPVSH